jgi:hypothetical protein
MNAAAQRHARCCELFFDVARSNEEACLRVTGTSMLPAVWPGDVLMVKRCEFADLRPGQIVLYHREGKLTAHRITFVSSDQLLTRGDSLTRWDPPVREFEIAGRVVGIFRRARRIQPEQSVWQLVISQVLQRSNFCVRIALFLGTRLRRSETVDKQVPWAISSSLPVTRR